MPPSTPRPVRYRGRDDHPLRLALLAAWGWCCYWQPRHALIPSETEIDHIIPDSTSNDQLARLITLYNLPADFDRQSPRNLAPICGPCNNEKSNTDFLDAPLVLSKLRRAAQREDQVVRQVQDYYRASAVAHHLVAAAAADLSQSQARGEYKQFAPAIVQTLARLDESAVDFQTTRRLHVDLGVGDLPTWVRLNTRGRTAESIIEDICGCALAESLVEGLSALLEQADSDAREQLERHRRETDDMSISDDNIRSAELVLVDLVRQVGTVTARFTGTLQATFTACLTRENRYSADYEMRDLFRTVAIDRDFTLAASWTLAAGPGRPDQVDTVVIRDNIIDAEEEARITWLEELYEATHDDLP